jgi:hypothetical protein
MVDEAESLAEKSRRDDAKQLTLRVGPCRTLGSHKSQAEATLELEVFSETFTSSFLIFYLLAVFCTLLIRL